MLWKPLFLICVSVVVLIIFTTLLNFNDLSVLNYTFTALLIAGVIGILCALGIRFYRPDKKIFARRLLYSSFLLIILFLTAWSLFNVATTCLFTGAVKKNILTGKCKQFGNDCVQILYIHDEEKCPDLSRKIPIPQPSSSLQKLNTAGKVQDSSL